jgi:hypothetical protein
MNTTQQHDLEPAIESETQIADLQRAWSEAGGDPMPDDIASAFIGSLRARWGDDGQHYRSRQFTYWENRIEYARALGWETWEDIADGWDDLDAGRFRTIGALLLPRVVLGEPGVLRW